MSVITQLPIPAHFNAATVGQVWRVPYQQRAAEAQAWAKQHQLQPAAIDRPRVGLLAIDVQNTFCIPGFELFVGGRSGQGAVADNVRLCELIYRNLATITEITLTLDTHTAMQIFHAVFWVNQAGEHPPAMTMISVADVQQGVWRVNPAVATSVHAGVHSTDHASHPTDVLTIDFDRLQAYALHYVQQLEQAGKYLLTVWPYHSMLGGIGHPIVSAVEEACFFHSLARSSPTHFEIKGGNPLTENYSALQPEVLQDQEQRSIAQKNSPLLQKLLKFDALLIAGQAKSHCVAWTIDDLLTEIQAIDPALARKVYLLEDCTSPVVVPGAIDFTEDADQAFQRFAAAGMNIVQSTGAIAEMIKPVGKSGWSADFPTTL